METNEVEELLSQAEAWKHIFAYAETMAVKCAVELGIPDIIHSHGQPMTLSQIASSMDSPSPEISYLTRIMRPLVYCKFFTVDHPSDGGEPLYGLTNASRWLLRDSTLSLGPILLLQTSSWAMSPWLLLSQCVKEGGDPFEKSHGCGLFEFASKDPEINKSFNAGMACAAPIVTRGILTGYKDGFGSMEGMLMDVGGGEGALISEIVLSRPGPKGRDDVRPYIIPGRN